MTRRAKPRFIAALFGALLFTATSCGSDGTAASQDSPSKDSVAASSTLAAVPTGAAVNINVASTSELETAFKSAGVTNPRRWAQEVDEYRPYPTDPEFAKLREELGKYNIDPAVLELIISTLEY